MDLENAKHKFELEELGNMRHAIVNETAGNAFKSSVLLKKSLIEEK